MADAQCSRVACSMLHIQPSSELIVSTIVSMECGGIEPNRVVFIHLHQVCLASDCCAAAKALRVAMLHRQTVSVAVQRELNLLELCSVRGMFSKLRIQCSIDSRCDRSCTAVGRCKYPGTGIYIVIPLYYAASGRCCSCFWVSCWLTVHSDLSTLWVWVVMLMLKQQFLFWMPLNDPRSAFILNAYSVNKFVYPKADHTLGTFPSMHNLHKHWVIL